MRPRGMWPNSPDRKWFFNFSVNAPVRCYGVGILGSESNTLKVTLSLLNISSGETVAAKHTKVMADANEDNYKVLFDRPVLIEPGTQHRVTAVSVGPRSRRAMNGLREVTCHHGNRSVTFTFAHTELRGRDEYDVSLMGHIPTIYFSFL
ncbi:BTB/POZ domain-containing protein 2 [Aphelenchoides avenae]|nr:BTB/POZ domain-containing protein 2 [Aphelenchus avenae]